MTKNFASEFLKNMDDEDTVIASYGLGLGEITEWHQSGSLLFNAVLSGSLFGGIPDSRITVFAGDPSVGKTYFALDIVKHFLDKNEHNLVYYMDTEAAIETSALVEKGIDVERVALPNGKEVMTVQKVRTILHKWVDAYLEIKNPTGKLMVVIDSLGMLPTNKELEDATDGNDKRDMTKAQQINILMRTLTPKLAKAKIPLIVTNHVYEVVGAYIPTKEMSGGRGLKFASSATCFISKKKDKDGKEVLGNLITVKMIKSRASRENREVTLRLSYDTGLDKYYGLLDLAEAGGLVKKVSTQYQFEDGTKAFAKTIYDNPEKYFTQEFLDKLEVVANQYFKYGSTYDTTVE